MRKRILLISGIVIGLPIMGFLALQLVPVWLAQINPPVVTEPTWDSPDTRILAERACFDCHSNETKWPWYSKVAPVSWLITYDVREGREKLNFSEWGAVRNSEKLSKEITKVLNKNEMPPDNYLLIHPDAQLSDAERQQLLDGLLATLQQP